MRLRLEQPIALVLRHVDHGEHALGHPGLVHGGMLATMSVEAATSGAVFLAYLEQVLLDLNELAGAEPARRINLSGDWWASWQTTRDGVEKMLAKPMAIRPTSLKSSTSRFL